MHIKYLPQLVSMILYFNWVMKWQSVLRDTHKWRGTPLQMMHSAVEFKSVHLELPDKTIEEITADVILLNW